MVNLTAANCAPRIRPGSYLGVSGSLEIGMNIFNFNNGQQAIIFMRRTTDRMFNCSSLMFITGGLKTTSGSTTLFNYGATWSNKNDCILSEVTQLAFNTTHVLLAAKTTRFGSAMTINAVLV
jgi:hypothetical protein